MKPTESSNEEMLQRIKGLQEMSEKDYDDPEDTERRVSKLKNKLIEKNIPLVKSIAGDFTHSGLNYEDLTQAGYIGLLNAAENFDLSKDTKFSTYATHLIKGEIRHHIRNNEPSVHIPQWIKRLNREVKKAEQKIYKDTGEFPTVSELSDELNIEEEGIREVLKARDSMNYVSIDRERRESDPRPEYIDYEKIKGKHDENLPLEFRVRIAEAIDKLTEVQKQVVNGIFYEDRTQAEIGEDIGTSQRQVSRIKYRVLDELKDYLNKDDESESSGGGDQS